MQRGLAPRRVLVHPQAVVDQEGHQLIMAVLSSDVQRPMSLYTTSLSLSCCLNPSKVPRVYLVIDDTSVLIRHEAVQEHVHDLERHETVSPKHTSWSVRTG
jgi:hypothetical protein